MEIKEKLHEEEEWGLDESYIPDDRGPYLPKEEYTEYHKEILKKWNDIYMRFEKEKKDFFTNAVKEFEEKTNHKVGLDYERIFFRVRESSKEFKKQLKRLLI